MRVLVTGGAGYVGSVTVRELLERGHDVTVLDTLERGHRAAVDARARLVVGSVGDVAAVDEALEGCSAVVHAAGYIDVAESVANPELYLDDNWLAPRVLLERMLEAGVGAIVFSSTAAVYGTGQSMPLREDSALDPISPYGESKARFEQEITARAPQGLRGVILRYFNVAGAWPEAGLGEAHEPETHIIPRVLCALRDGAQGVDVFGDDYATRDGSCLRDYIHVRDLADAHARAVEYLVEGGAPAILNLGSGVGYTNLEVVRECMRVTGKEAQIRIGPRRAGDPDELLAAIDAAGRVLGWTPGRSALDRLVSDGWAWHTSAEAGGAPVFGIESAD